MLRLDVSTDCAGAGLSGVVERNKHIGTIQTWGPLFTVSLDLKINSHVSEKRNGHSSIITFKGNNGKNDCCNIGDRIPMILYGDKRIVFAHSVNGNGNHYFHFNIDFQRWYNIIIRQRERNGKVFCYR